MTVRLTPEGCGAVAVSPDKPIGPPSFPHDLAERAEELDLGEEIVLFAWEIARLAEGLSPDEYRALMLLVLAAWMAVAEGSTRLSLRKGGKLESSLNHLRATGSEREAIERILGTVKRSDGGGLLAVFGGPGDYRPLIVADDCLYIQKLHVLEARVGRALRARIDAPGTLGGRELEAKGSRRNNFRDPRASMRCGCEARGAWRSQSYASDEQRSQTQMQRRPKSGSYSFASPKLEQAAREVFDRPPSGAFGKVELDDEQKEAVRAALSGRIAVVSGRPGSGKTSIVASILRVLARVGEPPLQSMALAAPTGKAADRMQRSIAGHLAAIRDPGEADLHLAERCPASSTLHRLLGYSPGSDRFAHNEHNPLSELLVIVDESSMIDLAMMDRLLRALRPEARVVFLGDADQLPSIEAGAVLRDLCEARAAREAGRVVVLERSYRAREEDVGGRRILEVAAAINEGVTLAEAGCGKAMLERRNASELDFEGVEHLVPGDAGQRAELLSRWWARLVGSMPDLEERLQRVYEEGPSGFDDETSDALQALLSHYERYKVLCVTRVVAGGTGSEAVNAYFHRRRLEELRRRGEAQVSSQFLVGEPVLITRNDYSLRLYNGDTGLLLRVAPSTGTGARRAEPMVVFPRAEGLDGLATQSPGSPAEREHHGNDGGRGGGVRSGAGPSGPAHRRQASLAPVSDERSPPGRPPRSDRFVAFPIEALRGKCELAWASTVHKAQGSEYDSVAIFLPEVPVRLLTRELVYTAVTRARRSVVIVGSGEVLQSAIARGMDRDSGVAAALEARADDA